MTIMKKGERLQLRMTKEAREYLEIIARRECRSMAEQVEYWILRQKFEDVQQAMIEAGKLPE